MHRSVLGYVLLCVILVDCVVWSTNALYAIGHIDDMIAKRKYQRRSFLKSFCARRCNIGKGGNVCRCNGFHFAGKRTSNVLTDEDTTGDSEEMIYKVLEDNGKLQRNPNRLAAEDTDIDDSRFRKEIENILPNLLRQDLDARSEEPDPVLNRLLKLYLTNDDINM